MKKLVTAASAALILIALVAPSIARSQTTTGDAAFAAGEFDAAASAYAAALARNPNDPNAELGMGTVELYRNQIDAARAHLKRALELTPNSAVARARFDSIAARTAGPQDYRIRFSGAQARVPLIAIDPLPTLEAKIDGMPMRLLIDTGAPGITLSSAAVARLHLATKNAGSGIFAGGLRAQVLSTYIDEMALPGLTVRGIPGTVVPGDSMPGIDGIVGTSFLYHFLATIDYRHAALVLRPATDSAAFVAAAKATGATTVPMWLAGDHFMIAHARVNRAPEELYMIDTGGAGVGVDLTKSALVAAGITPDATHPQSFQGGGGAAQVEPFIAESVSIGAVTMHDLPGVYFPGGGAADRFPFALAGVISHEFFRHMAVTFDFSAMQLVLAQS